MSVRRRVDLGAREVVADEEQRLAALPGEGVAEAVAKVEGGGVAALTVLRKCSAGECHLRDGHRYGRHIQAIDGTVERPDAGRLSS